MGLMRRLMGGPKFDAARQRVLADIRQQLRQGATEAKVSITGMAAIPGRLDVFSDWLVREVEAAGYRVSHVHASTDAWSVSLVVTSRTPPPTASLEPPSRTSESSVLRPHLPADRFTASTDGQIRCVDHRLHGCSRCGPPPGHIGMGRRWLPDSEVQKLPAWVQRLAAPDPLEASDTTVDEKTCPWCAETIKAAAVICRFCNRDVT